MSPLLLSLVMLLLLLPRVVMLSSSTATKLTPPLVRLAILVVLLVDASVEVNEVNRAELSERLLSPVSECFL